METYPVMRKTLTALAVAALLTLTGCASDLEKAEEVAAQAAADLDVAEAAYQAALNAYDQERSAAQGAHDDALQEADDARDDALTAAREVREAAETTATTERDATVDAAYEAQRVADEENEAAWAAYKDTYYANPNYQDEDPDIFYGEMDAKRARSDEYAVTADAAVQAAGAALQTALDAAAETHEAAMDAAEDAWAKAVEAAEAALQAAAPDSTEVDAAREVRDEAQRAYDQAALEVARMRASR